ncbi:MAG: CotH kinase family protein [Lachnospiraceae bacterium]|nr:CotH kinase family protein [Lachnospiraceae bacterium]
MNKKNFIHSKWSVLVLCTVSFAVLFSAGMYFLTDRKSQTEKNPFTDKSPDNVFLIFDNNYACVNTPLTVSFVGASGNDITYQWSIDGKEISNYTDTYIPTSDDLEKLITVSASDRTNTVSTSIYCSKLPVIYINTKNYIADVYVDASMNIQGNSEYTDSTDLYSGNISIKLRGNSTRKREKAPYKIKLDKKSDLFRMGENKHWVLLANDIDHTFIRNKLMYDFSGSLGADFAAESLNVALILNNEYRGVYQLCEHVRVGKERVDIFDWEELAEDAANAIAKEKAEKEKWSKEEEKKWRDIFEEELCFDFSWLSSPYTFTYDKITYNISDYVNIPDTTGGFLLEMDFYNLQNSNGLTTNYQQPFYFNTPEYGYTNKALKDYARRYLQSFEYALHSPDFTYHNSDIHYRGFGNHYDPDKGWIGDEYEADYSDKENDGKHYSQLFDMDSLIINFFVCEFSMNWDCMKNSVFVTKDLDSLAKLSPAWDFDWAFGNNNMFNIFTNIPTEWHTTNEYFTSEQYYQSVQWNRYLVKDPYFLMLAYNRYQEIRPTVIEDIIKDGGLLDNYYEKYYEAGLANDKKWQITYGQYQGKNYEESMAALKEFITTRIAWMDEQFVSYETFVNSIGYYKPDNRVNVTDISYNQDNTVTVKAESSFNNISEISFQINGTEILKSTVSSDGTASITFDSSKLDETGKNMVQIHGMDKEGKYLEQSTNYTIF